MRRHDHHHFLLLLLLLLPQAVVNAFCGLGFDFGTSGVRIAVLSSSSSSSSSPSLVYEASLPWPHPGAVQEAEEWRKALFSLLDEVPSSVRSQVARIAVSGTSASCLVVDRSNGAVRRPARLYNWDAVREAPTVGKEAQAILSEYAPPKHTTLSGTSTLMKVLTWQLEEAFHPQEVMVHQADFLAGCLMHDPTATFPRASDWNNMLKLGYDMSSLTYPAWFSPLLNDRLAIKDYTTIVPAHIVEPGQKMGPVSTSLIEKLGLAPQCTVVGGTTDSIAAFLAARVDQPGQAVSSLGSTLAIKMLSRTAVEDATRGVYSHRLGDLWLVGGASNVGCAALREQGFSNEELAALSDGIDPMVDSPLDYYPLAGSAGERFPTCDPTKQAVLTPKPESRQEYLHGILQGIAKVEKQGYDILAELGADPLTEVKTAGGGSKNPMWTRMRERILGVSTSQASETDAAYGAALLALKTLND